MTESKTNLIKRWEQVTPTLRILQEKPEEENEKETIKDFWFKIKENKEISDREKALRLKDFAPRRSVWKIVEETGWKRFSWWALSDEQRANQKRHQEKYLSKRKEEIINLKKEIGGCCICGYDRCQSALEFHHVDPKEKKGAVSSLSGKALIKEIKKCVLLCSNCHREYHEGLIPEEEMKYHLTNTKT